MKDFLSELETSLIFPEDVEVVLSWRDIATKSALITHDSFIRQYVKDYQNGNILRASSIGKMPALDLAAIQFNVISPPSFKPTAQQKLLFWTGDTFESWVYFQLCLMGYTVQQQLEVNYYGIVGHIDFLCTRDGESFVLETKTANDRYFDQVKKYGVGDERGYLTQLACYSEALGVPGYWLFMNKNTSELLVIPCNKEEYEPRLKRVRFIVDGLKQLESFEEAYILFRPVPPSVEITRDRKPVLDNDNRPLLYVPSTVANPSLHYITEKRKTKYGAARYYVTAYHPAYGTRSDVHADALKQAGL